MAGGIGYAVIDGSKVLNAAVPANQTLLWLTKTQDCSSAATGSSLFDFEGDGTPEVVYSDEQYFRIYKGTDGSVLWSTCNTTGTLVEYPLVADVDNDGNADIVVVSNSYSSIVCPKDNSKQRGLRVFGDDQGKWVRTRRVWNQHAYHVTNVDEDGTIPKNELPNWTQPRLNNFRQNVQPLGEFSAPDSDRERVPPLRGDLRRGGAGAQHRAGQRARQGDRRLLRRRPRERRDLARDRVHIEGALPGRSRGRGARSPERARERQERRDSALRRGR